MRFKTELLQAIRDGRKTVTRRLVKTEECTYKIGRIYQATNRPRFEASGMKANVTGGWFSLPIKIVSVRRGRVGDITEDDAEKEGFEPHTVDYGACLSARDQFLILWGKIHGYDFPAPNPEIWRIEFQRVPESWR